MDWEYVSFGICVVKMSRFAFNIKQTYTNTVIYSDLCHSNLYMSLSSMENKRGRFKKMFQWLSYSTLNVNGVQCYCVTNVLLLCSAEEINTHRFGKTHTFCVYYPFLRQHVCRVHLKEYIFNTIWTKSYQIKSKTGHVQKPRVWSKYANWNPCKSDSFSDDAATVNTEKAQQTLFVDSVTRKRVWKEVFA